MLRQQEDFEQEEYIEEQYVEGNSRNFLNLLVPLLVLITICLCTVMLVMVINLTNRVETLSKDFYAWRDESDTMLSGAQDMQEEFAESSESKDVAELENVVVWDRDTDSSFGIRRVYLTFDDGPSSSTDEILDILAQYGVKATFFVVGKDKGSYAGQYKRIVQEGHTLAMHSYSHVYKEIYQSVDSYTQDLMKLHDYLYELTGVDSKIVRFPGGSSNTISDVDMHDLAEYVDNAGMVYFDWNVSGGDSMGGVTTAEQIADNVLNNVFRYNNAVVLLHDAAGKKTTVEALPIIIEKILESDDTVLLSISEDTEPIQHLH